MPSRLSTLLREDAIDLGKHIFKDKNEKKSAENDAEQKQNEILYNGDNSLYKTCIICDKKIDGKRTDHFLSAITDKTARFRDGKMLSIGHPMNLVYCCTGCNNEQKKKNVLMIYQELKIIIHILLTSYRQINSPNMNGMNIHS
jgi:hypothetical protein